VSFLRAVTFLYGASIKNRVLRLVRHPKYLVFGLLGILTVGNQIFIRMLVPHPKGHAGADPHAAAQVAKVMTAFSSGEMLLVAALVFVYLVFVWAFGGNEVSLQYSEAEVQFLFPAPVTRKTLLQFKLVQSIAGTIFGSILLSLVTGRGRHPIFFTVGLFLALSTHSLHRVASSFVRTSLAEHGTSALKRRAVTLVVAASLACGFVVAFVTTAATFPHLEDDPGKWLDPLVTWSQVHERSLSWILLPLVAPARVMFAGSTQEFFRALPAALLLLALHYAWAMSSSIAFEEAAAESAEKRAKKLEAFRSGKKITRVGTRLFPLSARGAPWFALFWKNLVASGVTRSTPIAMVTVVFASFVTSSVAPPWAMPAGAVLATFAVAVAFLGPLGSKWDVRGDLDNLDLLRSYPLSGQDVVFGSVLAPLAVLTAWGWCLIASASLLIARSIHGEKLVLFLASVVGSALFLPALVLFGLLVQNLLAISFPALTTHDTNARGFEASGQRMVSLLVMVLVLAVTLLPAALLVGLVVLVLGSLLGSLTPLVAGAAAAFSTFAEAWVALVLASKAFEKLDVTERS
jgi:ABC-2 type transport system permease protein